MSHLLAPGVPPRRSVALQNAQQQRRGARSLFRRQALTARCQQGEYFRHSDVNGRHNLSAHSHWHSFLLYWRNFLRNRISLATISARCSTGKRPSDSFSTHRSLR